MKNQKNILILIIGIIISTLILVAFAKLLPPAVDWRNMYRPAAKALITGHSPYEVNNFSNAPWALIPMIPLLILSEALGRAILALAALISCLILSRKFGAGFWGTLLFLISPPVISLMLDGNIDWLVALGFILPPQIGLFFLAIKPQIGIGVAVFWFVQTWRKSGLLELFKVFGPVTLTLIISFLIFGLWPLNYDHAFGWGGNTSLWPVSIPVGLALLVTAIRKHKIKFAIGASPLLSPYLLLHSWIGPLIVISSTTYEMAAAVVGMWIVVAMRAIG